MEKIKDWIEQRLRALRPSKKLHLTEEGRNRLKMIYNHEDYKKHRAQFEAGVSQYGIMSFDVENAEKEDSTKEKGALIIAGNVTGMVIAFEMRATQFREATKKGIKSLESLPVTFIALLKTGRIVKIGVSVVNRWKEIFGAEAEKFVRPFVDGRKLMTALAKNETIGQIGIHIQAEITLLVPKEVRENTQRLNGQGREGIRTRMERPQYDQTDGLPSKSQSTCLRNQRRIGTNRDWLESLLSHIGSQPTCFGFNV